MLGLGQLVTQRGRSRVVEVVVKVGVRDGVASLGPVEDWLPAGGKQGVDAAVQRSAGDPDRIVWDNTHLGQSAEPMSLNVP